MSSVVAELSKQMYYCFMPTELNKKEFLLTDEENEEIKRRASEKNMSVSNLVRESLGLKPLERGFARVKEKQNSKPLKTKSE